LTAIHSNESLHCDATGGFSGMYKCRIEVKITFGRQLWNGVILKFEIQKSLGVEYCY
jgi:hypothetical protein